MNTHNKTHTQIHDMIHRKSENTIFYRVKIGSFTSVFNNVQCPILYSDLNLIIRNSGIGKSID